MALRLLWHANEGVATSGRMSTASTRYLEGLAHFATWRKEIGISSLETRLNEVSYCVRCGQLVERTSERVPKPHRRGPVSFTYTSIHSSVSIIRYTRKCIIIFLIILYVWNSGEAWRSHSAGFPSAGAHLVGGRLHLIYDLLDDFRWAGGFLVGCRQHFSRPDA